MAVSTSMVSIATNSTCLRVINNIFYGFATGISHADSSQVTSYDDFNCFNNNTADVSGWVKGSNDAASNPGFLSLGEYIGTQASTNFGRS